jgi:hypothetical protein
MKLANALQSLRPGAEFTFNNDDISTIVWYTDGVTTPTKEELDAEVIRLEQVALADIATKADAKAAALSKLQALGLTEEEAKAITTN